MNIWKSFWNGFQTQVMFDKPKDLQLENEHGHTACFPTLRMNIYSLAMKYLKTSIQKTSVNCIHDFVYHLLLK